MSKESKIVIVKRLLSSNFLLAIYISLITYVVAFYFDFSELFSSFLHKYEMFEADEIITVILVLAIYFAAQATRSNKKYRILLQEAKMISEIDYLTGINNRRMMNAHLDHLIKDKARYKSFFTIILFDLDNFKNINDTFGHSIGDDVLRAVSKTVKETVRESDIIGRWGGEEFIVLCPNTDKEGAIVIAEKLRVSIEILREDRLPSVTASFGVAICTDDATLDSALIKVDELMYKAKANGRNCIVCG